MDLCIILLNFQRQVINLKLLFTLSQQNDTQFIHLFNIKV